MIQLIFKGTFETQNSEVFFNELEKALEKSNSKFNGKVLQFEIENYIGVERNEDEGKQEVILYENKDDRDSDIQP